MSASAQPAPVGQPELRKRAGLAPQQSDPTRTKTLRDLYARQLRKRYRALVRHAVRVVVEQDYLQLDEQVFGIEQDEDDDERPAIPPGTTGLPRPRPTPTVTNPPSPSYPFPRKRQRLKGFNDWFEGAADQYILASRGSARWPDEYIRNAYGRGMLHADGHLTRAGHDVPPVDLNDAFNLPVHRDMLGDMSDRQFGLLNGLNSDMGDEVGRTLTNAMAEGIGPQEAGRNLANNIGPMGINRGNLIARTELIHGYNEGALNRYGNILGQHAEVQIVVEFSATGDGRTCPECEILSGDIFNISDARGLIPVHPMCRCAWLPVPAGQPSAVVQPGI